jgi:hypothetical protein
MDFRVVAFTQAPSVEGAGVGSYDLHARFRSGMGGAAAGVELEDLLDFMALGLGVPPLPLWAHGTARTRSWRSLFPERPGPRFRGPGRFPFGPPARFALEFQGFRAPATLSHSPEGLLSVTLRAYDAVLLKPLTGQGVCRITPPVCLRSSPRIRSGDSVWLAPTSASNRCTFPKRC